MQNCNFSKEHGRESLSGPIEAHQKITITITGNSLHFHRDTNFWFETTITLPAGTDPKQLHATIKGCPPSQADSIGQVVGAFFKIEDGTLTLATIGDDAEETPKSFEAAANSLRTPEGSASKEDEWERIGLVGPRRTRAARLT